MTVAPYRLGRVVARWHVRRRQQLRVMVVGAEKVPARGGVLIVANHIRAIDSVALGLVVSRQISFLAKSGYFTDKSLKGRAMSLGFRLVGQIPVDRSGGKAAPALDTAIDLLKHDKVVGIHGEGTRSRDGLLYDLQAGFTLIARKSRATVVPAALVYDGDVIEVHFGDPIAYSTYKAWNSRHFATEMTHRIQRLSGQTLAGRIAEIADKVRHTLKGDEGK